MGKKISGKRGFYRIKGYSDLFYRHYAHDDKNTWEHNTFNALVLPEKGEVIIHSRKDREYLIIKAEPSKLVEIGKLIRDVMDLNDLINKLFERQALNYNIPWSRLDEADLNKKDPTNYTMRRLTWL